MLPALLRCVLKPGFLSIRAASVRWARCCCLARCLCVLNHPTDCCRTAASRLPRRCVLSARGRKSLRALRWRPPPQRWPALASAPKPADGARCPARLALPAAASVPPRAGARPVPGAVRPRLRAAEPAPWRGPVCAPHGLPCALTSVASSAPPPQTDEAAAAPVHLLVDLRGQGARWCCCPLLLPVPLPPPPPAPAPAASPASEVPRRSAKRLFTLTPLVACAARCCAACLPPLAATRDPPAPVLGCLPLFLWARGGCCRRCPRCVVRCGRGWAHWHPPGEDILVQVLRLPLVCQGDDGLHCAAPGLTVARDVDDAGEALGVDPPADLTRQRVEACGACHNVCFVPACCFPKPWHV